MLFAAAAVVGCADSGDKVVLSDQNTENQAYEISALAYKVVEAKSYEEFKAAREELEKYEEAFRTQIGGDAYLIYLEECNYIFEEL
jgi:hypothetical protein